MQNNPEVAAKNEISAAEGETVGMLLRGIQRTEVERGDIVIKVQN